MFDKSDNKPRLKPIWLADPSVAAPESGVKSFVVDAYATPKPSEVFPKEYVPISSTLLSKGTTAAPPTMLLTVDTTPGKGRPSELFVPGSSKAIENPLKSFLVSKPPIVQFLSILKFAEIY